MDYIVTQNGELVTTDELYHWGIKGMKWGRRLYQNKDGSLTPLGKKRYAKEEAALKERERTIKNREREVARRAKLAAKKADLDAREEALNGSDKGKTSKKSEAPDGVKKNVKDMSDEELNQAIQRARMEDAYRQLRPDPVAKPGLGKRLVDEVAIPALMSSGKKAVESIIDKSVKDLLKDKVDPNSLAGIEAANKKLRAMIENDLLKRGIDPNLKGENLEKWKTFNDKIKAEQDAAKQAEKAAKQAEKDAKQAEKDAKQAEKDAKQAEKAEAEKKAAEEAQERGKAAYEQWKQSQIERHKKSQEKSRAEAENLDRYVREELDLYITHPPGQNSTVNRFINNINNDPSTVRGRMAYKELNRRINWDEYVDADFWNGDDD